MKMNAGVVDTPRALSPFSVTSINPLPVRIYPEPLSFRRCTFRACLLMPSCFDSSSCLSRSVYVFVDVPLSYSVLRSWIERFVSGSKPNHSSRALTLELTFIIGRLLKNLMPQKKRNSISSKASRPNWSGLGVLERMFNLFETKSISL